MCAAQLSPPGRPRQQRAESGCHLLAMCSVVQMLRLSISKAVDSNGAAPHSRPRAAAGSAAACRLRCVAVAALMHPSSPPPETRRTEHVLLHLSSSALPQSSAAAVAVAVGAAAAATPTAPAAAAARRHQQQRQRRRPPRLHPPQPAAPQPPRRPPRPADAPPRRDRVRGQHAARQPRRRLGAEAGVPAGGRGRRVPCPRVCVQPRVLGLRGHGAGQVRGRVWWCGGHQSFGGLRGDAARGAWRQPISSSRTGPVGAAAAFQILISQTRPPNHTPAGTGPPTRGTACRSAPGGTATSRAPRAFTTTTSTRWRAASSARAGGWMEGGKRRARGWRKRVHYRGGQQVAWADGQKKVC